MDNDSVSFDYMEIKLNAGWEGWKEGIGKILGMYDACICLHWKVDLYQGIYAICALKYWKLEQKKILATKTE